MNNADSSKEQEITLKLPASAVSFIVGVLGQTPLPFVQTSPLLNLIRSQYESAMSAAKKNADVETEKPKDGG